MNESNINTLNEKKNPTQSILYTLPGIPTPLMRARFSNGRVYDGQKRIKTNLSLHILNQHGNAPLMTGPLHLDVDFYFPLPAKMSLKNKEKLYGTSHIYKPDLDNLIKMVDDLCNNVVYGDDCIIASLSARKRYDILPRTEFVFKQL